MTRAKAGCSVFTPWIGKRASQRVATGVSSNFPITPLVLHFKNSVDYHALAANADLFQYVNASLGLY